MTLRSSSFFANRSGGSGGGLAAYVTRQGPALTLDRMHFYFNQAQAQGAAAYIIKQGSGTTAATMTNSFLASNRSFLGRPSQPSVIAVTGGYPGSALDLTLKHLTWAEHPGHAAVRLYAWSSGSALTATVTNALISEAGAAFAARHTDGTLNLVHTNTLAHVVDSLHIVEAGSPIMAAINPVTGDPRLGPDLRLQRGSAAINAGVEAGVARDIDRQARIGPPDIGADEFVVIQFAPVIVVNRPN